MADGKGTVYGLAFADFDGNGWPDIVAARSDAPNGIWFSTKPGDRRGLSKTIVGAPTDNFRYGDL